MKHRLIPLLLASLLAAVGFSAQAATSPLSLSGTVTSFGQDGVENQARRGRGADDGAGHQRRGRGRDDGPNHTQAPADQDTQLARRGRGSDDGAGHRRGRGREHGPNHT